MISNYYKDAMPLIMPVMSVYFITKLSNDVLERGSKITI